MKKSLTNYRPEPSTEQAEKAFYSRLEQDYFLIRKIAKEKYNPNGVEPIITTRIEKIQHHIHRCKHVQPKLKELLSKYQTLLQSIQTK